MKCDVGGGGAAGAPAWLSLQPEADGSKGPLDEKEADKEGGTTKTGAGLGTPDPVRRLQTPSHANRWEDLAVICSRFSHSDSIRALVLRQCYI